MKIFYLSIYTLLLFIFTACGEVTTSDGEYSNNGETPFILTIDNKAISKTSHSRVKVIVEAEQNICVVSINKQGSIQLSQSEDMDLFELVTTNNTSKVLKFITTPEISNSIDSNKDGVYEVDIKATDFDGNSIIYKVAYEIYKKNTDAYKVSLPYSKIQNYSPKDIEAPRIQSFSVTGNSVPQSGKVIVSKSKLNAKFSLDAILKDSIHADSITLGLKGGSNAIELNYTYGDSKAMHFDCTFDNNNGINQGVDFTCNDIRIQNSKGNADTFILFTVCNNTTGMCSSARLPILFID